MRSRHKCPFSGQPLYRVMAVWHSRREYIFPIPCSHFCWAVIHRRFPHFPDQCTTPFSAPKPKSLVVCAGIAQKWGRGSKGVNSLCNETSTDFLLNTKKPILQPRYEYIDAFASTTNRFAGESNVGSKPARLSFSDRFRGCESSYAKHTIARPGILAWRDAVNKTYKPAKERILHQTATNKV